MKQKARVMMTTYVEVEFEVEPRKSWRDGDRWADDVARGACKALLSKCNADPDAYGREIIDNLSSPQSVELPGLSTLSSDPLYCTPSVLITQEALDGLS